MGCDEERSMVMKPVEGSCGLCNVCKAIVITKLCGASADVVEV